jgi:hypothetical protein
MENGQLNHLIQNAETADPIQLDSLIEMYPAISMLKVLKLKSVFESTGEIDQKLWDQLLIEWPDKKSLLKLKSVGFDPNKVIGIHATASAPTTEPYKELENFHLTDTSGNLDQINHLGFIYEMPPDFDQHQNIQPSIPNNIHTIEGTPTVIIDEDKTPTEPDFKILADLTHVGFIYEFKEDPIVANDIVPVSNEIDQLVNIEKNEKSTFQETENSPLIESIDDQIKKTVEDDPSLSAYVNWLKVLNHKQHLNISDYEKKKKMKKKSKKEKPEKDNEDRKDRTKTAKKLLKKSKKMEKDLVKKQEKSKKKTKKKSELSTIIEGSLKKTPTVITETYADLLAKQGYIDQSIEMFEKLSLLIPEKSTYFAAKILKLKNN